MKEIKLNKKIETGFITPSNYFEDFSLNIMKNLPKSEVKTISLWQKHKSWLYATAAVIVIALSLPIMNVMQQNNSDVYENQVANYINYTSTITQDDLLNHIELEELKKINLNSSLSNDAIEIELLNNTNLETYIVN